MITLSKKLKQPPDSPKNKKIQDDITKRISIRDKLLIKGTLMFGYEFYAAIISLVC